MANDSRPPPIEPPRHASLAAAICAVIAETGKVHRGGWNDAQRYKYVREEDILNAVRIPMTRHGISVVQSAVVDVRHSRPETKSGAQQNQFDANFTFTVTHTDSGNTMVLQVPGCGQDANDKGPAKAMTGAKKNALMQLFALATTDEDPDAEGARSAQGEPMCTIAESNVYAELIERAMKLRWTQYAPAPHVLLQREKPVESFVGAPDDVIRKYIELAEARPTRKAVQEAKRQIEEMVLNDNQVGDLLSECFADPQKTKVDHLMAAELDLFIKRLAQGVQRPQSNAPQPGGRGR